MDMEFMDLYRRSYSGLNMQSYNGPPHAASQSHQHHQHHQFTAWSPQLMAFYQQYPQRPTTVIMNHANMQNQKQTEPKPRLAKDEVDLLEREFAKNSKPNSSTKRELAEQMGVEVPRINNWFQNRRAKEKQMRKAREFEADQARERAASDSKSPDDETEDDSAAIKSESTDTLQLPIGLSRAALADEDLDVTDDDRTDAHDNECSAKESDSRSPDGDSPDGLASDGFVHVDYSSADSSHHGGQELSADDVHSHAIPITFSPNLHHRTDYQHYVMPEHAGLSDEVPAPRFDAHSSSQAGFVADESMFGSFPETDYYATTHNIASFHGQMMSPNTALSHDLRAQQHLAAEERIEQLSPLSSSASPPATSDLRFKSPPPPADIASRRNMRRPAPLGLASLRSSSNCHGAKTGIEGPRRSDAPSPMRRIASATGMSGRIQKPLGAGPRSPFPLDRNREALFQNIHHHHHHHHQSTTRSSVMGSLGSALSPLTPEGIATQGLRETTVSTNASDEEQGYVFGSMGATFFQAEHTIKTPPETPGLPLGLHEHMFASSGGGGGGGSGIDHHQAWQHFTAPPDEQALPTPSLGSHGSELDFPSMAAAQHLPSYVASQPATPSFPSAIGPTYSGYFGKNGGGGGGCGGSGLLGTEYTFPDSYAINEDSARSSPGHPKTRQFQFAQNITPQDFNKEK